MHTHTHKHTCTHTHTLDAPLAMVVLGEQRCWQTDGSPADRSAVDEQASLLR